LDQRIKESHDAADDEDVAVPDLGATIRRRTLAGDARAGSWARNKARRRQRRFLRENWVRLSAVCAVMLAAAGSAASVMPTSFTRGLLLGVGVTSTAAFVVVFAMQSTGTSSTMMGAQAEQWTASELRPLQRQGWRVVHHVSLRAWDIDHVLVGPGGAFAVETKWSSIEWTIEPGDPWVAQAVRQVASNARDLRLWSPLRKAGTREVQPVLILWGAGLRSADAPAVPVVIDGVVVVPGPAVAVWRSDLSDGILTAEQVDACWRVLDAQVRVRDQREGASEPTPLSAEQMLTRTAGTAMAALAGVLTAAWLVTPTGASWVWLCLCVAAAFVPHRLRRRAPLRLPVLAWQTGVIGTVLIGGGIGALNTVLL